MPGIVLEVKVWGEDTNELGYDFYYRAACWLEGKDIHINAPLQCDTEITVTYKHSGGGSLDEVLLVQTGNSGEGSQKEKYLEH